MGLINDLAGVVLDPSEDTTRFVAHCNSLLRRTLRLYDENPENETFSPDALSICICAHSCGMPVLTVHKLLSVALMRESRSSDLSISEEDISYVWSKSWEPAAKALKVGCDEEADPEKNSTRLFEGYNVLLVPSLLFSANNARLLLNRLVELGGKGKVYSPGSSGFKEVREEYSAEQLSSGVILVCVDLSIVKNSSNAHGMQTRPVKWLRDSIKDKRIKSVDSYMNKSLDGEQHLAGSIYETPPKRRRLDFRAELNAKLSPEAAMHCEHLSRDMRTKSFLSSARKEIETTVSPVRVADGLKLAYASPLKSLQPQERETPRVRRWACEVRTCFSDSDFPVNEKICELLGVLQQSYETKKDRFRASGYQRAIARIRSLQHEIVTADDVRALSRGHAVGQSMERKIMEVVMTGRLLQAETILQSSDNVAVQALCSVWGVGPVKALHLVQNGVRSVSELREALKTDPDLLDKCQKIGLRHYEDLLLRIPRFEVSQLEGFVRKIVKSVAQELDITVAGSYLRGKKDCGDVDIMIHGPERIVDAGFRKVRDVMKRKGVLTDDLVEGHRKYFGVFRIPGRPHGRIDLFAVPEFEYPFALLTYTGSAIFNRSMRAKARALGYSLSHKGIQRVSRSADGKSRIEPPIRVKNEREIFLLLDIPYVVPAERSI